MLFFWHYVVLSSPFFKRDFRLKKEPNALPSRPRRFAVRAVKAAEFAFTGAERTALTEEADGGAQPFGGKGRKKKRQLRQKLTSRARDSCSIDDQNSHLSGTLPIRAEGLLDAGSRPHKFGSS